MKIGDTVQITPEVFARHPTPFNRFGHRTAVVVEIEEGRVTLDRQLAGCRRWMECELMPVPRRSARK